MYSDLIKKLPESVLRKQSISKRQDVPRIMQEVLDAHQAFAEHYDRIGMDFYTGTIRGTAQKLFNFCKRNMLYVIESEKSQTTRSPQAILKTAQTWGVDCKHYAGFIGGCLDAIKRAGVPVNWCYRFVSYSDDPIPEHVFIVVKDGDKNIFVDPVVSSLDLRSPVYYHKIDKFPGMLNRISGFNSSVVRRRVGYALPYSDEYMTGGGGGTVQVKPPSFVPISETPKLPTSDGIIYFKPPTETAPLPTPGINELTDQVKTVTATQQPTAGGVPWWMWLAGAAVLYISFKK